MRTYQTGRELTSHEIECIYRYTVGSVDINTRARSIAKQQVPYPEEGNPLRDMITGLDSALNSTILGERVVLFRTVTSRWAFGENTPVDESLVGSTYSDGAYLSTSPCLGSVIHVAGQRNSDTLIVMKITSGSRKGMYVNKFSEKRGIEFEFLKPRTMEYFIESVVPNVIIRNRTYNIVTVRDTK